MKKQNKIIARVKTILKIVSICFDFPLEANQLLAEILDKI